MQTAIKTMITKTLLVSFYETPLVCGAAPEIGCGTLSKPLLLELENNEYIKSAWLNRTGTIIAIQWNSAATYKQKDDILKMLSAKHQVAFSVFKDPKVIDDLLASFYEEHKWYSGYTVDELSLEEAGIIAQNIVSNVGKETPLTEEQAAKMKAAIEMYFKQELVKIRTKEELYSEDLHNELNSKVIAIGENYIGVGKMPSREKIKVWWQEENKDPLKKDAGFEQPITDSDLCCPK